MLFLYLFVHFGKQERFWQYVCEEVFGVVLGILLFLMVLCCSTKTREKC